MNIINPWYQLGYIIPHIYTDMDAYQFYRVAPEGMMLVTTGLNLQGHSLEAVENELPAFWNAVDLLAKRKVDRIALSGVPVASMLGRKRMRDILAQALMMPGGLWHGMHAVPILEAEFGKPVLLNILATTRAALVAAGDRMQVRPDPRW